LSWARKLGQLPRETTTNQQGRMTKLGSPSRTGQ
jgi:hypothetical protein